MAIWMISCALLAAGEALVHVAIGEGRVRRFIQSMIDSRSSSTERSMPAGRQCLAQEMITDTPAISCGYWKARKMLALARLRGQRDVVAVETKAALGDHVRGWRGCWPGSLPEPFGPMMACTSPVPTVIDAAQDVVSALDRSGVEVFDLEERRFARHTAIVIALRR